MMILDPARSDQFRTAAQHASFHVPTARRDELATILDAMDAEHGPPNKAAKAWAKRVLRS